MQRLSIQGYEKVGSYKIGDVQDEGALRMDKTSRWIIRLKKQP